MKFRLISLRLLTLCCLFGWGAMLVHCSQPECTYDTDCSGSQVCTDGSSKPRPAAPACTSDTDCQGANQKCIQQLCVTVPPGYRKPAEPAKPEPTPEEPTVKEEPAPEPVVEEADASEPTPEEPIVEKEPDLGPPPKCTSDADCASRTGTFCIPDASQNNELYCLPGNTGAASFGETCDPTKAAPGDCQSTLCYGKYKKCTKTCRDSNDCPGGGSCDSVDIGNVKLNVCFPGGDQCSRNNDCSTDQSTFCILVPNITKGKYETRCQAKPGSTKELGEVCDSETECYSGVCIKKSLRMCSVLCDADADCGTGYVCKAYEFTDFTNKQTYKICQPGPNGVPCDKTGECVHEDYFCSPKVISSKIETYCQQPKTGAVGKGQPCTDNDDCQSRYCLPDTDVCATLCKDSTRDCVGGLLCNPSALTVNGTKGSVRVCTKSYTDCKEDANCTTQGEICSAIVRDTGEFKLTCVTKGTATAAVGEVCSKDEDCASRICLSGRCSKPCNSKSNLCPAGYDCNQQNLTLTGFSPIQTTMCVRPGTGLTCATRNNCASQEECQIVEKNNTLSLFCNTPGSSTSETGKKCTQHSDCASNVCLLPEGYCSAPCLKIDECLDASKTPPVNPVDDSFLCTQREVKDSTGKATKFQLCGFKVCEGDADCPRGQICQYTKRGSDTILSCREPETTKAAHGAKCTQDADCQSGLCHPTLKTCSPPCNGGKSTSCPLQFRCESTANGPNNLNLCATISKACDADSDCQSGEFCTLSYDTDNRAQRTCDTAKGSSKIGDTCDPSRTDQCQTGLCDPSTRRCSIFCKTGGCTAPYSCTEAILDGKWPANICRQCFKDSDCATGEACKPDLGAGNQVVTSCVAIGTKSKKGDTCTPPPAGNTCATGLCEPNQSKCTDICQAHRDCAPTEYCGTFSFLTTQINACITGARQDCQGNADCPSGEVCKASLSAGGVTFSCVKPSDPNVGKVGDACTSLGQCQTSMCNFITNKCTQTCTSGLGDCPSGEVCTELTISGSKVFACAPPPQVCKKTADCTYKTTICTVRESGKQIDYLCLPPDSNAKKAGSVCALNADCQSGLCHPSLKVCVDTCEKDADCTSSPRTLCGSVELSGGSLARACVSSGVECTHDAVCPSAEPVCALDFDLQGTIIKKCIKRPSGKKKIGDACTDTKIPGDCENRFCEAGTQACVATCGKDADCPKGLVCGSTFIEGNKAVRGCVPDVGASCQKKTDCAAPNVCRGARTAQGIVYTCQAGSGAATGSTCDSKQSIFNSTCTTKMCHPDNDRCVETCNVDADCGVGKCRTVTVEGFQTKLCDAACESSKDCPSGQVCTYLTAAMGYQKQCRVPDATDKKVGATCTITQAFPNDCQTRVCGLGSGKCEEPCKVDADCASGFVCAPSFMAVGAGHVTVMACVPDTGSCSKADDCKNGYVCRAEKRNAKLGTFCAMPGGSDVAVGGTCNASASFPNTCATRLCDGSSLECTVPCTVSGDCLAQGTRASCGSLTVDGKTIKACVK